MKKMTQKAFMTAALAVCLSCPVIAAAEVNVGVSAMVGTTGLGIHAAIPVLDNLNARFGFNTYNYNVDGSTDDMDYKFKLKLSTFDVLADWHPMQNNFRVTAGILWNGNKIDAKAKANSQGEYTFQGNTYDASNAGNLKGRIEFNDVAPYLGIGWGNSPKNRGWSFSGDLGVIFQGSPSVSLKNRGCNLGATLCDQLANDLEKERKELEDEVEGFRYYPVIRFGASYMF